MLSTVKIRCDKNNQKKIKESLKESFSELNESYNDGDKFNAEFKFSESKWCDFTHTVTIDINHNSYKCIRDIESIICNDTYKSVDDYFMDFFTVEGISQSVSISEEQYRKALEEANSGETVRAIYTINDSLVTLIGDNEYIYIRMV